MLMRSCSRWALLFSLLGAPYVPYVFKRFKDIQHSCGWCKVPLAIVHRRDGSVELLVELSDKVPVF
jgi:hypothetical protein